MHGAVNGGGNEGGDGEEEGEGVEDEVKVESGGEQTQQQAAGAGGRHIPHVVIRELFDHFEGFIFWLRRARPAAVSTAIRDKQAHHALGRHQIRLSVRLRYVSSFVQVLSRLEAPRHTHALGVRSHTRHDPPCPSDAWPVFRTGVKPTYAPWC